jgi:NADPH:quinone reductase-like Zn-dependent oxidoreductase
LSELDLQARRGDYSKLITLPAVLGYEISGIIRKVGSEVKTLSEGDEVVGRLSLLDSHLSIVFAIHACHHNLLICC